MTSSDTAAALASALPAGIAFGQGVGQWWAPEIAAFQAERLAEQGWTLVRPDDQATVERVAALAHLTAWGEPWEDVQPEDRDIICADVRSTLEALATLAAPQPDTAEAGQTEVAE